VAALLLTLLPGDITYVCVTGLFLAMKVKYSGLKETVLTFNLEHLSYLSKASGIWIIQHRNATSVIKQKLKLSIDNGSLTLQRPIVNDFFVQCA
jgi:hypothetical protein